MRIALALTLVLTPVTVAAQPTPTATPTTTPMAAVGAPALTARAQGLLALFGGTGDYDRYFDARFRAAVPRARMEAVVTQTAAALGRPQRIAKIVSTSRWTADVTVAFARGTATLQIAVAAQPPHAVTGLLVTGTTLAGDTLERVQADLRALPGATGIGVYALQGAAPAPVAEVRGGEAAPLGSAFKLWVLAEAARQVAAGERRWSDVVPAGPRSLGGTLGGWPKASPVTLQTLATLMISISDNTATDTLMAAVGRDRVDAMAVANGGQAPVPTTRELIAIKADPALTRAWAAASPDARRRMLAENAQRFAAATLDASIFSGQPIAIDSVEWFASPRVIAATLDRLRRDGGETALGVLAVEPGVDAGTAARFAYLGFKGGSEPGVATLSYLARTRSGHWFAVTGNWHRSDAAVDEAQLVALMTRALALVADR